MGILSVQKVKTMYLPDVYTSLEGLYLERANVVSIKELGAFSVEWVTETGIRRIKERTPAKIRAKEEIEGLFSEVEEQVYFKIKEKSFFVDIYIQDLNVAVMVDKEEWCGNKGNRRDEIFNDIGVRTVRVSEKRVMDGHLIADLHKQLGDVS